jgi:uncharacterized membrane protein YcaP (DUF421 family)
MDLDRAAAVDWTGLWRPVQPPLETVVRAVLAYAFIHVSFRLVGRKELGRHSTYEIVLVLFVTVAMRTTIVGNDVSLTTAFVGFSTLLLVDLLVARLVRTSPSAARVIDGPVRELVRDGRVDEAELNKARLSREQLLAELRVQGHEHLGEIHRAYFERSGRISFVLRRALPRVRRRSNVRRRRVERSRAARVRALRRRTGGP